MAVSKLRVTAGQLLPRLRTAAKSSSNVEFIPPPAKRSMAGMMTYLQALKCLQEGEIIGKPKLNEHGHWEVRMRRFAANQWTEFDVVAVVESTRVIKIYVLLEK